MNKDEILEKAKKENLFNDEAKNNKDKKGRQWGVSATGVVVLLIMFINYMNNKDVEPLFIIYGTYIGFNSLGMYFANKEKSDLIPAIGGLLMAMGSISLWLRSIWNF